MPKTNVIYDTSINKNMVYVLIVKPSEVQTNP